MAWYSCFDGKCFLHVVFCTMVYTRQVHGKHGIHNYKENIFCGQLKTNLIERKMFFAFQKKMPQVPQTTTNKLYMHHKYFLVHFQGYNHTQESKVISVTK